MSWLQLYIRRRFTRLDAKGLPGTPLMRWWRWQCDVRRRKER